MQVKTCSATRTAIRKPLMLTQPHNKCMAQLCSLIALAEACEGLQCLGPLVDLQLREHGAVLVHIVLAHFGRMVQQPLTATNDPEVVATPLTLQSATKDGRSSRAPCRQLKYGSVAGVPSQE